MINELDVLLGRLRELATANDEQHVRIGSDVSLHDLRKANVQIGREVERRAMGVALREVIAQVGYMVEGMQLNHKTSEHRDTDCCSTLLPGDVRQLVADAASALGVKL